MENHMAIFDVFKKKEKPKEEIKAKTPQIDLAKAKYPHENCAVCNQPGCDKKWGGQYWHKKCLRSVKGMAKDML